MLTSEVLTKTKGICMAFEISLQGKEHLHLGLRRLYGSITAERAAEVVAAASEPFQFLVFGLAYFGARVFCNIHTCIFTFICCTHKNKSACDLDALPIGEISDKREGGFRLAADPPSHSGLEHKCHAECICI